MSPSRPTSIDAPDRPGPVGDHRVHFFDTDDGLVDAVGGYLTASLRDGDTLIVITTAEHRERFNHALATAGLDCAGAAKSGHLLLLDAADTLARFTVDGRVDGPAFHSVIGTIVRDAVALGRPVRLYGAMVAVLWERGDVTGAMELEAHWNDLADQLPFSLVCAYPSDLFDGPAAAHTFADVCHAHSDVIAAAPGTGADAARRFPRTPHAARLARRFVEATFEGWALQRELLDDVLLVTSELVTNAVRHAASDVFLGLTRTGDGVRVTVGDASPAPPAARAPRSGTLDGRGLFMVDAIARAWGHDVRDGGKVVWAEFGVRGNGSDGRGHRPR